MTTPNPNVNPDGIRRYEELSKDALAVAQQALAIAIANSVLGSSGAVLDIEHGGTGSPTKTFVDTFSNQFQILGAKIFHDSIGFQKDSDVVDSGELAGNIRLITCDAQAQDIGPQMRFSGRNTDGDLGAFSFATIAGRKSNSISGDKSGYLQFASTTKDGVIIEGARLDEEQTFGIGTPIPVKRGSQQVGQYNRLWVSGGDIFLDNVGGERQFKIQLNKNCLGRIQARFGGTIGSAGTETIEDVDADMVLSTNIHFLVNGGCVIDDDRKGTTAIHLDAHVLLPGTIEFMIGEVNSCPIVRGQFHNQGLDVAGNILATGDITAGGPLNVPFGTGNNQSLFPGFIGGDNIHTGDGNPENVVNAPVGAIYGRRDADTSNHVLYVKTADDYGPTGWSQVPIGQLTTMCVAAGCPDPADCSVWFDTVNNMGWYWNPNAKGTGVGAWLSQTVFQASQRVPLGEFAGGLEVAEAFRGRINRHYVYLTPTNIMPNARGVGQLDAMGRPTNKFDMYLQSLTATLRVRNNGLDPVKHYYQLDLITLSTLQGEPLGGVAKQEWPGDRAADDNSGDQTDGDNPPAGDVVGLGHTFHPLLPPSLIARSISDTDGVVYFTGTITAVTGSNRRIGYDPLTIQCFNVNNVLFPCPNTPNIALHQFQQNLHRDVPAKPYNTGWVMEMTSGPAIGNIAMVFDNTASDSTSPVVTLRRPFQSAVPNVGDTFLIANRDYKRVITRLTTKGNVNYPSGYYANNKTKDIQQFVETGAKATNIVANDPTTQASLYPNGPSDHYLPLNFYIPLVDSGDGVAPVDAEVLCLLWDSIGAPGLLAGSVSVTFRLALPFSSGICV